MISSVPIHCIVDLSEPLVVTGGSGFGSTPEDNSADVRADVKISEGVSLVCAVPYRWSVR